MSVVLRRFRTRLVPALLTALGVGLLATGLLSYTNAVEPAAAAFYYLRVVVYMFMREPQSEQPALSHGRLLWGGLIAATVLTVLLGVIPGPFLEIVNQAARAIG